MQLYIVISETCSLWPDIGPCRGRFPMYYYDTNLLMCLTFNYGGCGGNLNRFSDKESCMVACGEYPPSIIYPSNLISIHFMCNNVINESKVRESN